MTLFKIMEIHLSNETLLFLLKLILDTKSKLSKNEKKTPAYL